MLLCSTHHFTIMFAQLFSAVVSAVDVVAKTVTSTVDVVAGRKTPAEALSAVAETVTESPLVKSVTGLVEVASGDKTWEDYGTDLVESARNTTLGSVVEGVIDVANGKDVGDALVDAAKKTSVGEAIDTTVQVISGESSVSEGVNKLAGEHAPIAKAVNAGSEVITGEMTLVDAATEVAQAVTAERDPRAAQEIGVVKDQLMNEPDTVSKAIDKALNQQTEGFYTAARDLVDSTGLTNMKERQLAAIESFQEGNIGDGVQHAVAATGPVGNLVANTVDNADNNTEGAFGHAITLGAPKADALTGMVDATLDLRSGGYFSKVRDVSDSMGITDIKEQMNGGFDALINGDFNTAAETLLLRVNPIPNVLSRMAEKGTGYWEDLQLPDADKVVALTEKAMGGLPSLGSSQRLREEASAFIEDLYAGEFSQAANRAHSLRTHAENAGINLGSGTDGYIEALDLFAGGGEQFDALVDASVDRYLNQTGLASDTLPPQDQTLI